MTPIKRIKLKATEYIVAVVPESCAGPGWSNAVTWVYICDGGSQRWRCESIQPTERSNKLDALWRTGAVVTAALLDAIPTTITEES